jgi:hypothetical protein
MKADTKVLWRTAVAAAAWSVLGMGTAAAQAPKVEVLSSLPEMVTGGDALIKVWGNGRPAVALDGADVTAAFRPDRRDGWVGLVTGLRDGDSALTVRGATGNAVTTVFLTNHPLNGTLFAGTQQRPFICENVAFRLAPAKDADCGSDSVVRYAYLGTDDKWKDFDLAGPRPTDIAETTVNGTRVPMIVRTETGVINRAGYVISMLHDPAAGPLPTPDNQTANKAWNGKLIYGFGGGMAPAFHMGRATGLNATFTGASIMGDNLIKRGYALASATLNRAGGNNNDVVQAETIAKVKEHFIEEFGPPLYTVSYGPSGGAMMQNLVANNYPGLFDAVFPERLYADSMTFLLPLYDCELLKNYFDHSSRPWTDAQKTAVAGTATWGFCTSNATRYPNARPDNCDASVKTAMETDLALRADPPRCTYQDNLVNVFGRDLKTGDARNPFDNVGVQYGLTAFNQGLITFEDFVDLNRRIGGHDADGKIGFSRQVGDPAALKAAYETGRINQGGAGLSDIPIVDIRTWHELASAPDANIANVDVHNSMPSKVLRDRLVRANGDAGNMASVIVVEVETKGEGTPIQLIELKYLTYLDQWLTAIAADPRNIPKAQKVRLDRPVEMADACYPSEWMRITDMAECNAIFPHAALPRSAAGGPPTEDVFKCQLKPVAVKDYRAALTAAQLVILKDVFPNGVCDYTRPGVGQVPLAGTWLVFPQDSSGGSWVATTTIAEVVDEASRVVEAQQRLVAWGYDVGPADGILGPKTRAAVIEFQKARGIQAAGQITDELLSALRSAD